jgi:outer membrane lipoprotein LolB
MQEGARMILSDGREVRPVRPPSLPRACWASVRPFTELPRWVTARVRPHAEVRALDALGRPLKVIDGGWTIDYVDYVGEAPDDLPRKIDIHRGDTRLRLIVDSWNP